MKCKNCGAELNNGKCEYCGAVFSEDMRLFILQPHIDEDLIRKVLSKSVIMKGSPCKDDKERLEITCLGDSEPRFIEV